MHAVREAGAAIWVLLERDDPARQPLLDVLDGQPGLEPSAREWPDRRERGNPAAVVVRHPAPERAAALKHRLDGAKVVVLAGGVQP